MATHVIRVSGRVYEALRAQAALERRTMTATLEVLLGLPREGVDGGTRGRAVESRVCGVGVSAVSRSAPSTNGPAPVKGEPVYVKDEYSQ